LVAGEGFEPTTSGL